MAALLQDLRYGARLLVKNPGFSAIAVLTLALGIGLTTMMFSIVNGAILRGLPFEEADRLMHLHRTNLAEDIPRMDVSVHDFADWRQQQQAFEGLAAFTGGTVNVSGTERAERFDGAWITANGFDLLRVRPVLGRSFVEGEDAPGAAPVVIIGYRMWQDYYQGDPQIVGKTLRANGEETTIVGVMPEKFAFPMSQNIWLPLRKTAEMYRRGAEEAPGFSVFGRLRQGVSVDQANTQMNAISRRLALEYPETNAGVGAVVKPYVEEFIGKEPRMLLFTMLGAVFGVLLIACANAANLLLSQAALRAKEVGIRTAMGASRGRVILQFLTEPLAIAVVGALLGVGIAWIGIRLFNSAIAGTNPPFWIDIRIDTTVLLFVLAITLFATFISGILPAIRASGGNVSEILKDETRGSSSMRSGKLSKGLVIFEIALSVALLVGAGLMIKSVAKLRNIDFGFATEDVFTARVGLPEADQKYADAARRLHFFEEVEARIAADPGVRAAALTTALPGRYAPDGRMAIEGKTYEKEMDHPRSHFVGITPAFFETFGVGMLQGRAFTSQDREGSLPVAIVNQSFARKHFPQEEALGKRIRVGGADSERPWLTIVGVVPGMYPGGVENELPEAIYTPVAQDAPRFLSIAARTRGNPTALTPPVREAVSAVDADIPIYFVYTLAESIAQNNWHYRVFGSIFVLLGFVALFLAAIGLYGVMAFSVSRRTREMGVRMALGARPGDVKRLIVRQGIIQLAIGLTIGLAMALGVSRLLAVALFQVDPRDPMIFAAIVVVLSATGVLASWVPARRATRVDPMVALRYE
ncbi:ABC transporter permease [soil metagenome]